LIAPLVFSDVDFSQAELDTYVEKLGKFFINSAKYTSEKTKGAIKRNWQHLCTCQRKPKGKSRETGNIYIHVRENQRGNQEKLATSKILVKLVPK
jgi:sarcosine oxidase delta subunit